HAFSWTNELGEGLLCALIWIGLSAAVKTNSHIGFDLFVSRLSPRGKKWMGVINMALFILYLAILAYLTREMIQPYLRRNSRTPIMGLNYYWVRLPMVVGSLLACVRLLIKEYRVVTDREKMYATSSLTE
ncbi:MAG: TRAP transporter small permease, partial [Planctomycetes bacterium]|nr:TRAP transporter small permease [Planctomycetota bacterium]